MVYNGETPGWPSLDQSQLTKFVTKEFLEKLEVKGEPE